MAANSLRQELMDLDGVAEAEVDESADSPSGVRVRLEPEADARLVGIEVQRVLAAHGLRSKITGRADEELEASASEAVLPGAEGFASGGFTGSEELPIPPPPLTPPPTLPPEQASAPEGRPARAFEGLRAVAVEESIDGLSVIATASDGRTATRGSAASEDAMGEAVVLAVASLASAGDVRVVSVAPAPANGSEVVTVVVAFEDGAKSAGAAITEVTRAWAVGRAAWAALRS